jgi:uncharacterized MAPEG superfamily protein
MWIDVVAALAVIQFLAFGIMVGAARNRFGVHAPATTGHPQFERMYRVQMNTLEQLVALLPALYLASHYWSPSLVAGGGVVYLVGRLVYLHAYLKDPSTRTLGFALSVFPILAMLAASLVGAAMAAAH